MNKLEELNKELGNLISINQVFNHKLLSMKPKIDINFLLEMQRNAIAKIKTKLGEINNNE